MRSAESTGCPGVALSDCACSISFVPLQHTGARGGKEKGSSLNLQFWTISKWFTERPVKVIYIITGCITYKLLCGWVTYIKVHHLFHWQFKSLNVSFVFWGYLKGSQGMSLHIYFLFIMIIKFKDIKYWQYRLSHHRLGRWQRCFLVLLSGSCKGGGYCCRVQHSYQTCWVTLLQRCTGRVQSVSSFIVQTDLYISGSVCLSEILLLTFLPWAGLIGVWCNFK